MDCEYPTAPLVDGRKRKRVTRACDACRQHKVKCNGQQPCVICVSHEIQCTYDRPSIRARGFSVPVTETTESRLQKIEATLKDLAEAGIDVKSIDLKQQGRQAISTFPLENQRVSPARSNLLEVSLDAGGKLDVDDHGHHSFHGHSSGIAFLEQISLKYENLLGPQVEPRTTTSTRPGLRQIFDSDKSSRYPLAQVWPDLPPRDLAEELVRCTLENICPLERVVHKPTFDVMFNRVYTLDVTKHGLEEVRFRPLLFAIMAVGSFASTTDQDYHEHGLNTAIELFGAAKGMTDITDCMDLTSLQTIMFMIIFLQCSSKMSTCYIYLGIAIKSAVRMGLHRRATPDVSLIERETRSRIFWVLRKMDIYVSTMLGLPSSIADEDIDQDEPLDNDDDDIRKDNISSRPCRRFTQMTATVAHVRLIGILKRVTKDVYPIKGVEQRVRGENRVYFVNYSKVRGIETSLEQWFDSLPEAFRLPTHILERFTSCLLRISYYHIRLLLYRPFVRYLSYDEGENPFVEKYHASAAAACLDSAKHIVHISYEMKKDSLNGGHWFALYATFFAVFSLLYFVLESPSDERAPTAFEDAKLGRELLASLCDRSPIAERCTISLKSLFGRLPDTLAKRLGENCMASQYGYSMNSSSTTLENFSDVFGGLNSMGTKYNKNDSDTRNIAASIAVNSRFAISDPFESSSILVKEDSQIYSRRNDLNKIDLVRTKGPQLSSQGRLIFPLRDGDGTHYVDLGASTSPATTSLANINSSDSIPVLGPPSHYLDSTRSSSEPDGHSARAQNPHSHQDHLRTPGVCLFAPPSRGLCEEQVQGCAGSSAPGSYSQLSSWSDRGPVEGSLPQGSGADINMGYFFDGYDE